ncbi:uncharacterized protein LOC594672 [Strongylocentrotus purpuratus]|uniref:EF-hand calcium-binding domain-containing protein 6 n=1 Tax=Strongylocentrotus purpuratus TaxID=7668 RepID=A0A7M7HJK0_STRPU|nr:uncharacterized protein LOC594672 [Strongylocentrotus purpuratus]
MPESYGAAEAVEDHIRTFVLSKSVRVAEFFKDFDSLRSGFVTRGQFRRCLDQGFNLDLQEDVQAALIAKYETRKDGADLVNYQRFADVIERTFQPDKLQERPETQIIQAPEILGTSRTIRPLSPASQSRITGMIQHIAPYYKYHEITIRSSYEDFDKHNKGIITEPQFFRSFPYPPGINEEDVKLLAKRYRDPSKEGICNYLNFHNDVEKAKEGMVEKLFEGKPPATYNIPKEIEADGELNQIFSKIQVAIHKFGIRTPEFFRDHDKLRSYIITENQFKCGLLLCVGNKVSLTRDEVQKLVDYYKRPDGRVHYKEFCDLMENAFNDPNLEKKPTTEVYRPRRGELSRTLNTLSSPNEEDRLSIILDRLSTDVKKRRLMMIQYFQDYDRSKAYTRNMTKIQFGRMLHFLTLNVGKEDFEILCRKFEDPSTKDTINYPAFVQAVDKEYIGFTTDKSGDKAKKRPRTPTADKPIDSSKVNVAELVARIRHHILTSRIRVCEYFHDFDPLRERSIPRSKFRMGLSAMGLSALGQFNMTEAQFKALSETYADPANSDAVLWQNFEKDIETVFTQVVPNLEKTPTNSVVATEQFLLDKPGTIDWSTAPSEVCMTVDEAMNRMRERVEQRRVLLKPCFEDFDNHNMGIVTKSQFRQCLFYLGLNASEEEMLMLEAKYTNVMGFNYIKFLEDLQPKAQQELKYVQRLKELDLVNNRKVSLEKNPLKDADSVMEKVKTKVIKERMRVHEFMRNYDKLRTGRMLKENFRRALDNAGLGLQPSEVEILINAFESPRDASFVEYLAFSDHVESIFTLKNLEKDPLITPEQFKPAVQVEKNILTGAEENILKNTVEKLAQKVNKGRVQLYPLFEDYDRVHNGTVSRSQFRRVLSELELAPLVNEVELDVLWKKFEITIGGKFDVDYCSFCDLIYKKAKIELFRP